MCWPIRVLTKQKESQINIGYTWIKEGELKVAIRAEELDLIFKKLLKEGSLRDYVYDGDVLLKYKGKSSNIVLPNCFTEIAESAFEGNRSLRGVSIPESYIDIGAKAFRGCKSLTSVELSESIVNIADGAFSGCVLWSLTLPSRLSNVGRLSFSENKQLRIIDIKGKNTWFEKDTFRGCDGVYSMYIHKELLIGDIGLNSMDGIDIIYK